MGYSFASAALWATTGIFIKFLYTVYSIPLAQLLWLRFLFALFFSAVVVALIRTAKADKSSSLKADILSRQGMGLASLMTVYYICATVAFSLAPVSLVVLVIAATPVIAFLLQFLKYRVFHYYQVAGFFVTLLGIGLYVLIQEGNGNLVFDMANAIGATCALGAATVRAAYTVFIWRGAGEKTQSVSALSLNMKTMLVGSVICLPVLGFNFAGFNVSVEAVSDPMAWVYLLSLAAVATVLPTTFNTMAASRIDPVLHNIICMSTPVLAGLFAWVLLEEQQSLWSLLAAAVIVIGIVISIRPQRI